MASSIMEQKCPNCGAMLRFDPNEKTLVCDYCDSVFPFKPEELQSESIMEGFHFEDFAQGYEQPDAEQLPIYICNSCGAELIAPAEQLALTCPYCRNNIVLSDKVSGNLRPNGVIPFEITPDQLPGLFRKHYAKNRLLPKNFFSKASLSGITGVYVPFWLFSGRVNGDASFVGTQTTHRSEGNYLVTEVGYYEFGNTVDVTFEDVPVDASARIEDVLMDSIEPFHMEKVQPFDTRFLAGFTADRFDTPAKDIEARALKRLQNTADALMAAKSAPYADVRRLSGNLNTELSAKYYLLPVYLFQLEYNGKKYTYAVNGETGKVSGSLPNFNGAARKYFLPRFLAAGGGFMAIWILKYFLGG